MSIECRASVAVIGVGNAYLSDEGVAGRVLDEVARRAPPGVEVIDAGLPGPDLLDLLRGRQKAVIVDAVDADGPPGTVYRFHPEDAAPGREGRSHSLHDGNVLLYVNVARALGMGLEQVVVIGVQPKDLSPGRKLSPAVEEAVAEAAERVLTEVRPPARPADRQPRAPSEEVPRGV